MKLINQQEIVFLLIAFLLSGCGLFENEQEPKDFGFEEVYFIYNSNGDKKLWTRNRNYVSIELYEEV